MSIKSGRWSKSLSGLEDLPAFDLTYRFDDDTDPSEVTVFPDAESANETTRWLTVDVDHSVSLEDTR